MPTYRQPFVKGRLIIVFSVKFPEEGFLSADKLPSLERLLPDRTEVIVPDAAEECDLVKFDPEANGRQRARRAYMEDDDEDGAGPRVQCASH